MSTQTKSSFGKPVTYAEDVAAVIGKGPLARSEVTKRIWAYIKEHQLQDAKNKKVINLDEKLKKIFDGRDSIDMFEMTKLLAKQLSNAAE